MTSMLRFLAAGLLLLAATSAAAQGDCPARLFVSGFFSTVHVYDACTGAYLRDLDARTRIRGAMAVRLGPDGKLYVVSEETGQILRYRNDTLDFDGVAVATTGMGPTGLVFGPAGELYVDGYRTNDVRVFDAAGTALGTIVPARAGGLRGPDVGMAWGADGNLYVPGFDSNSVVRYDPRTAITSVAIAPGTAGLSRTRALLQEPNGRTLLVTGEGSGQLLRYDPATGSVTVVRGDLAGPLGLDYAPDGNVLVATAGPVLKLDAATGATLAAFVPAGSGGLAGATNVSVIAKPGGTAVPAKVAVVEFYNPGLDHYFISALAADIAALDSGSLRGWTRTGLGFNAYPDAVAGTNPVCRFYLPPVNGDSHFYSASPEECGTVAARFPSFIFESPAVMYVALPDARTGACPAGTEPIYRLWNARVDSNHRYTRDPAMKAAMVARGYVAEGYGPDAVIMCAPA